MKTKINKKTPVPNLTRIIILVFYSVTLFVVAFSTWYYFVVTIPMQEAETQKRRIEIIEEIYRAKYCNKLPYESDAVKRLCASATPSLDAK